MRIKILIGLLIIGMQCYAQAPYPIYKNSGLNLNHHTYFWINVPNGNDTVAKMDTSRIHFFKPIVLPTYTTGSEPAIPWSVGADADSVTNALWYRDGSGGLHRFGSIGGTGGGGSGTVTSIATSRGITGGTITTTGTLGLDTTVVIPFSDTSKPGGIVTTTYGDTRYFKQGGNSFGTTATFGTNDNNPLVFRANSANVLEIFANGHVLLSNSGTDGGQLLQVPGTVALGGVITTTANSGYSIGSTFGFTAFGANNASNNDAFQWAMNNNFANGATKNFFELVGSVANTGSGTYVLNELNIDPTINNTNASGTSTVRGVYFNPTNTSLTTTTVIAFENVSGIIKFDTVLSSAAGSVVNLGYDTVSHQVVRNYSSGGSGVTTVGSFSGSSMVNGASISGSTITFGPADGTNPGMVTTGTQTFAGLKNFSTGIQAPNNTATATFYHFLSTSTIGLSSASGTGAGGTPTLASTGPDQGGIITLTTGTAPAGTNATIGTFTYSLAFPHNSYVVITPANANTAALNGTNQVYIGSASTTGFTLVSGTVGLTTLTSYAWYYYVSGN